jgi:hypothetical protein
VNPVAAPDRAKIARGWGETMRLMRDAGRARLAAQA